MSLTSPTPSEIREELGSPTAEEISDATLQRCIDEERTYFGAAARAAEILHRKWALQADVSVEGFRQQFSTMADRWKEIARDLRRKAALYGAKPYFGGTSLADKDTKAADADRPEPAFTADMWDRKV